MECMEIFIYFFPLQLIEQRLEKGCDRLTLIDKLLRMMEESEDISVRGIKSECNTIMMAVRSSITEHDQYYDFRTRL